MHHTTPASSATPSASISGNNAASAAFETFAAFAISPVPVVLPAPLAAWGLEDERALCKELFLHGFMAMSQKVHGGGALEQGEIRLFGVLHSGPALGLKFGRAHVGEEGCYFTLWSSDGAHMVGSCTFATGASVQAVAKLVADAVLAVFEQLGA